MAESTASKFAGKITSDGKIGQGGLAAGVGGTDWQSTIVTGTTLTAVAGKGYWIDTTSNACTVTLPASASVGDFIEFSDYARNWGTNAVTLNPNSLNFQGFTSPNPEYNTDGQSVRIVYSGATQGWIPTVDDDVTNEVPQLVSAEILVIAGGAGGSHGGGGAGGYRTSTENLTPSSVYTITVGDGGASTSNTNVQGNSGSNSSISGTGISITSAGGGTGGGRSDTVGVHTGTSGGSGGGGGADSSGTGVSCPGGSGNTPSTSPSQGNNGGSGAHVSGAYTATGGGGGAGAVGSSNSGS